MNFTIEMQEMWQVCQIMQPEATEEEFLAWWHEYKVLQEAERKKP